MLITLKLRTDIQFPSIGSKVKAEMQIFQNYPKNRSKYILLLICIINLRLLINFLQRSNK